MKIKNLFFNKTGGVIAAFLVATLGYTLSAQTPTDLGITLTADKTAATNEEPLAFTLTVTNNGTEAIAPAGVVMTFEHYPRNFSYIEELPPGCKYSSQSSGPLESIVCLSQEALNPDASVSVVLSSTVGRFAPQAGFENTMPFVASVAVRGFEDTNSSNDSAELSIDYVSPPDLSIEITASKTSLVGGDTLTYTLTYDNSGDSDATNVVITNTYNASQVSLSGLPENWVDDLAGTVTCNLETVPAADPSQTITYNATVEPVPGAALTISTASIASDYQERGANRQNDNTDLRIPTESDAVENIGSTIVVYPSGTSSDDGANILAALMNPDLGCTTAPPCDRPLYDTVLLKATPKGSSTPVTFNLEGAPVEITMEDKWGVTITGELPAVAEEEYADPKNPSDWDNSTEISGGPDVSDQHIQDYGNGFVFSGGGNITVQNLRFKNIRTCIRTTPGTAGDLLVQNIYSKRCYRNMWAARHNGAMYFLYNRLEGGSLKGNDFRRASLSTEVVVFGPAKTCAMNAEGTAPLAADEGLDVAIATMGFGFASVNNGENADWTEMAGNYAENIKYPLSYSSLRTPEGKIKIYDNTVRNANNPIFPAFWGYNNRLPDSPTRTIIIEDNDLEGIGPSTAIYFSYTTVQNNKMKLLSWTDKLGVEHGAWGQVIAFFNVNSYEQPVHHVDILNNDFELQKAGIIFGTHGIEKSWGNQLWQRFNDVVIKGNTFKGEAAMFTNWGADETFVTNSDMEVADRLFGKNWLIEDNDLKDLVKTDSDILILGECGAEINTNTGQYPGVTFDANGYPIAGAHLSDVGYDIHPTTPEFLYPTIYLGPLSSNITLRGNIYPNGDGYPFLDESADNRIAWPENLVNLSTRGLVETGEHVMIGSFIVSGDGPQSVLIRGLGPSLETAINGSVLNDPELTVVNLASPDEVLVYNDNWQDMDQATIVESGLPPDSDLEAALVTQLQPGAYSAILNGVNDTTGIGMVEVYDLANEAGSNAHMVNLSTRCYVQPGDQCMIGGLVIDGLRPMRVYIRATGPSLPEYIENRLADPVLALHSEQTQIAVNDNWMEGGQVDLINATGIPPADQSEAAMVITLDPGAYTAVISGVDNASGYSLLEIYYYPDDN